MSSKCTCRTQWRDQHVRCNCSAQTCQQQVQNGQAVSMSQNSQEATEGQWLQLRQTCNKGVEDHVDTGCTQDWQCSEHSTSLTYVKAVGDPIWGEMWKDAIKAELTALAVNSTWEEVISFKNINIITSKWVFKSKLHTNSSLDKLKAQVVARDFSQMHDIDYEDTFAPTVKFDTLCIFLTLVALENLKCHQVNVNNAFTEFFLKKIIYMTLSSDVEVASDCALHIMWSLYRLKQVTRDWHEWCVAELVKIEFYQSDADSCLLLHSQKSIMLLLYVDNIVVVSAVTSAVTWFKESLAAVFKVKNLRETQKILDIQITCDCKRWTLCMDQTHYVKKMLQDLHMETDKHKCTEISLWIWHSLFCWP